jgi:hypothetical protein
MSDTTVDPAAKPSWFDNLKAQTRHILLLLAGSLITAALLWASTNGDTILAALNVPPAVWPFAATVLAGAVLRLTAITKQYGLWANPEGSAAAISGPSGDGGEPATGTAGTAIAAAGSAGAAVYPPGATDVTEPVMTQDDEATDLGGTPVPERELLDPVDGVDR